jgi:serine/threonine protein kinase
MSAADLVSDLLVQWDDLREQGQQVSAEELCRDRPELLPEVKRRIHALESMYRLGDGLRSPEETLASNGRRSGASDEYPVVPGYEIEGILGRGGMGIVYRARQTALNRPVALKMILGGGHAGPSERARFRFEAEAVARLQHPNIVQIYEVGEQADCPYLALELVEGTSLAERLKGKALPAREAADIVRTLARAVHFAHQRGVVHRDLKPANILLTGGSALATPKITDFGLAKRLDGTGSQTQTGAVLGTPSYMAPEQAAGKVHDVGTATDIHALGVMLYEMLTGRPPFGGSTLLATLEQVRSKEPEPPRSLQPQVPRDLETICLKCLQKEPQDRYASAQALADDLDRFMKGELIHAQNFTIMNRLARTLNRSQNIGELGNLSGLLLALSPIALLTHLILFLLLRREASYPAASLWATFALFIPLVCTALWAQYRRRLFPSGPAMQHFWSTRIGQLVGLVLIVVVCYQIAAPGGQWQLTVYPLWMVLTGATFFGLGSTHWGRLYVAGLVCFAASLLMLLHLEWAPLELGAVISGLFLTMGLHLRGQKAQPD